MALVRVVQGQAVEATVAFRDAAGTTIVGEGQPASWTIRDYNNDLIASGAGTQETPGDSSVWTARFTIPSSAPISQTGERYQIYWEFPLERGTLSAIERFEVIASGDPISESQSSDVLMIEGKRLVDSLVVPSEVAEDTLRYQVQDLRGTVLIEEVSIGGKSDRQVNGQHYYDFVSDAEQEQLISGYSNGLSPFMGVWEYCLPGETTSYEFHGIYVANLQAVAMIQKMRGILDRANLQDIHPFLTFTDLDLMHYLQRGFEYINSLPPSLTGWSPLNVPQQAHDLIINAGAMRALQAQYLAEGMSTFDFQGLGVQLSIDRTQYIQTMVDQIQQDLQDRVPRFKRLWIRSSSPGVLSISVTPLTNFVVGIDASHFTRGELYRAFPFTVLAGW